MIKRVIITSALSLFALTAIPAKAQGIPVIDPGNIAQTIKVVQNGVQQVEQMKAQVEELSNLKSTIGEIGEGEIGSILNRAGLNLNGNENNLLSQFRQTIPGILDGLPNSEVGQGLGINAQSANNARTSIQGGREFVLQTFFNGTNASIDEVAQRQSIREAALRDSASTGFSTAVSTKVRLAETENTLKVLAEQMTASGDVRTDIQNNSAVGMASLQQLVIQTQLLAQLLEVQSTGNMATGFSGN